MAKSTSATPGVKTTKNPVKAVGLRTGPAGKQTSPSKGSMKPTKGCKTCK